MTRSLEIRWIKGASLVVIGCVAAVLLQHSDARATETVYVLKSTIFAVIALLGAHPYVLGIANAVTALLLFSVGDDDARGGLPRRLLSKLVVQLSRSAGHLEGLFTWLALAVWWVPSLDAQITAVLAVTILGPLVLDTLADHAAERRWRLLVSPAVTLFGLVLVLFIDPAQWRGLLPLASIVLAGLLPRTIWSIWTRKSVYHDAWTSAWAPFVDRLILASSIGAMVILPLHALRPGHRASLENRIRRVHGWLSSNRGATRSPAPFSLFLVADNQFHALDGKRSGFHMDFVDTEVPVSVRPVELDLLSAVTLRSFALAYREMRKTRPAMRWAHLGDGADIGCVSELERFLEMAPEFGVDELAAVIPGNHDGAFLGNLSWHPDWDAACPQGRSNAAHARQRLATLMPDREGRVVNRSSRFLTTATSLGTLGREDIAGVFLDTTDAPRDRVGVAGAQGGISDEQASWVETTVAREFSISRIILFGHHPIDQWTPLAREQLERIARSLGPRLWAVISAHTHLAAMREHRLGGRAVPEFILGSTIDPPQEAALLEAWVEGDGKEPLLRIRTLPAVKRPASTRDDDEEPRTTAESCRSVFEKLAQSKSCAPLFQPADQERGPSQGPPDACAKTASLWSPLLETGEGHVESPAELECLQEARAERLLTCLGVPDVGHAPLSDPRLPKRILSVADRDPAEMICFSWAASILQSHKRNHWGMAQAIAFSLDPSATWSTFEAEWPTTAK